MASRMDLKSKKQPQKNKKGTKINAWMWAFFVLLAIVIGTFGYVGAKVLHAPKSDTTTEQVIKGDASFSLSLTKKQTNTIVDYYLKEYLKKSPIQYALKVDKQAVLTGSFKFLNYPVKFKMYLDPYVLENGDVQLKARQLSIGQLNIPMNFVMNYIKNAYKIPKWVTLNTKTQTITLKLNQFKLSNGTRFTVNKIDLSGDEINLNIFLPNIK